MLKVWEYLHEMGIEWYRQRYTMNIDSECLTIEFDQGSLGLAVKKLGGHLLVQETGAVHALDSLDRDVAVAPGAGLGSA